MSNSLEKFSVFSEISEQFKQNIDLFHVFDDSKGKNVFIVTKDDKVFAFGCNHSGKCGFGHNREVETPQEIPELNGKQIKQFFIGSVFVLALNEYNKVFGWGENCYGQLGRGYHSRELLKPEIIVYFDDIIGISCGSNHSLALDKDGHVFCWGNNYMGQVGCKQENANKMSRPVQLKSLPKIKTIGSSTYISFALTFDGLVYCWGYNGLYFLGNESQDNIFEPKLTDGLDCVISVGFSQYNTYFLTTEGNVYFCGQIDCRRDQYQKTPIILDTDLKFQSLQTIAYYSNETHYSQALVSTEDRVYCLDGNSIHETEYKTISDYCLYEKQITPETTVHLNEYKSFKHFNLIQELGTGAYGRVVKVMNKRDNKVFAIKMIEINTIELNDKIDTEVKVLSNCCEEYVVKYYGSWTEKDLFYIQMELLDDNLQNIILEKRKCFARQTEPMTTTEFFISSELLREVLECVQYLHELKPEIIHRDLKPQNILVKYEPKDRRFLKLADFGLATFGSEQTISHSMWTGTRDYMAPEVKQGNSKRSKYSSKVDIYSLGQIICDLFDTSEETIKDNAELKEEWDHLENLIGQTCNFFYRNRPTYSQILESSKFWLTDKDKILNRLDLVQKSKFFYKFFSYKIAFELNQ